MVLRRSWFLPGGDDQKNSLLHAGVSNDDSSFSYSAVYHIVHWTPGWRQFMRQMDHANIFILIAGNYTPFSYNMLSGNWRTGILAAAWGVVRPLLMLRDATQTFNAFFFL